MEQQTTADDQVEVVAPTRGPRNSRSIYLTHSPRQEPAAGGLLLHFSYLHLAEPYAWAGIEQHPQVEDRYGYRKTNPVPGSIIPEGSMPVSLGPPSRLPPLSISPSLPSSTGSLAAAVVGRNRRPIPVPRRPFWAVRPGLERALAAARMCGGSTSGGVWWSWTDGTSRRIVKSLSIGWFGLSCVRMSRAGGTVACHTTRARGTSHSLARSPSRSPSPAAPFCPAVSVPGVSSAREAGCCWCPGKFCGPVGCEPRPGASIRNSQVQGWQGQRVWLLMLMMLLRGQSTAPFLYRTGRTACPRM
jgi:hypothetical protein